MLYALLTDNGMSKEIIIWSLFAGIMLAALSIFVTKRAIGPFIDYLIFNSANSPETAKTLEEGGFASKKLLIFALRRNRVLRGIVTGIPISEDSDVNAAKAKPTELRYYIPPDKRDKADEVYANGGASVVTLLIAIAGFLVTVYLVLKFIPILGEFTSKLGEYISFVNSK